MKVSIVTIHNIHNFGSVFQAYALNHYLNNQGYTSEIIDYNPRYFTKGGIRTRVAKIINFKSYNSRLNKYNKFINKNIKKTSREYENIEQLRENLPKADVYIAGGDQLWNNYHDCGNDPVYKLLFTNKPKISYGTSLGRDNFDKDELNSLKVQLKDFKTIGVRESSSIKMLESVGFTNVNHVADPVLLLSGEEYVKFMKKPLIEEKYLFVYLIKSSELLEKAIEYISSTLGLKVVLSAGFSKKCTCDYFLKDLGPEETLSYIKHASFVISASFHATIFSIMFNKEFITLLPGRNTNARIENLLEFVGLKNRIIHEENQLSTDILSHIDYTTTNEILDEHIKYSKEYIKNSLDMLK